MTEIQIVRVNGERPEIDVQIKTPDGKKEIINVQEYKFFAIPGFVELKGVDGTRGSTIVLRYDLLRLYE